MTCVAFQDGTTRSTTPMPFVHWLISNGPLSLLCRRAPLLRHIRSAYRYLRDLDDEELTTFFSRLRINTRALKSRGPSLPLNRISRDDRYLIAEMACKSFAPITSTGASDLYEALLDALRNRESDGVVTVRDLQNGATVAEKYADRQQQLVFSADDLLDQEVIDEDDLQRQYDVLDETFREARNAALDNTRLFLSMIEELDAYIATSMRTRQDFREMADFCEFIFDEARLAQLHLRFFDPTLSAGIPVGAMVTSRRDHVQELLVRLFENRMEYDIEQEKPGHLRLRERLTGSVVRLQTSDSLLRETFWNYYHRVPHRPEEQLPGVGVPRSRPEIR